MNRWDICAPQAILEAMGGALAKLHQVKYDDDARTACIVIAISKPKLVLCSLRVVVLF